MWYAEPYLAGEVSTVDIFGPSITDPTDTEVADSFLPPLDPEVSCD